MRRALSLVALVGLLAVAAAGTGGEVWRGGRDVAFPVAIVDYAYTLGIILLVALVVSYLALRLAVAGIASRGEDRGRWSALQTLLVWAVVITVAWVAYRAYSGENPFQELWDAPWGQGEADIDETLEPTRPVREPRFQWWLAAVVATIAAAAALYFVRTRRRPQRAPTAAEDLEAVLTEALGDLEFDEDPRRAVIQAYARMERVLAVHGLPRKPHEAPLEFLARVLRELEVRPAAAHALTELFERAKFSRHEIDAAMKEEAIESLEAVRDDLREAA